VSNQEQLDKLENRISDDICQMGNMVVKRFNEWLGEGEFEAFFRDCIKQSVEEYLDNLICNDKLDINISLNKHK